MVTTSLEPSVPLLCSPFSLPSSLMGFPFTLSFHSISSRPPFLCSHILNGLNSHSLILMSSHHLPLKSRSTSNSNLTRRNTDTTLPLLYSNRNSNLTVRASTDNTPQPSSPSSSKSQLIIICSAITVTLAVANRVLYKLALVPMKQYPFFLAQLTTFGYVVIYFLILCTRYRMGIVTDEMISLPKSRFMAIGILEALGVASGMASAAMLPGPAIPILNQTFLVWQLALSAVFLGKKYSFNQIAGCLLVATGVVLAVASGSNAGQMLSGIAFVWPAIMIASCAFQAGASIIKEFIFVDASKRLKGKSLDIFVVNSFGSGFQALFVLLLLPLLSNLKGIPFVELPSYVKSGAGCFLNMGGNTPGCGGAPRLPLLYIITNMAFNISVLTLLKISSAVIASLVVMLSVPLSIYILSLPLPYLPDGASLSPFFVFGSLILLLGLILYNIPQPLKQKS